MNAHFVSPLPTAQKKKKKRGGEKGRRVCERVCVQKKKCVNGGERGIERKGGRDGDGGREQSHSLHLVLNFRKYESG